MSFPRPLLSLKGRALRLLGNRVHSRAELNITALPPGVDDGEAEEE